MWLGLGVAGVRGLALTRVRDDSLDIPVVDDESALREQLRRLFTREGHPVLTVPDGRGASDRTTTDRSAP